jgi:hypothetical protein
LQTSILTLTSNTSLLKPCQINGETASRRLKGTRQELKHLMNSHCFFYFYHHSENRNTMMDNTNKHTNSNKACQPFFPSHSSIHEYW